MSNKNVSQGLAAECDEPFGRLKPFPILKSGGITGYRVASGRGGGDFGRNKDLVPTLLNQIE